ncbi:MAG: aminopeptidase [Planctomycetes bacterium]|nr:aminopeptidase [Planctomycetota bacterium]
MDSPIATRPPNRRQFLTQYLPAGALGGLGAAHSVIGAGQKDRDAVGRSDRAMPEGGDRKTPEFEQMLERYADVVVNVGLNLRPGQSLLMVQAPIECPVLVRQIAVSAYKAGARYVDVVWRDQQMDLLRFQHAPRDSFGDSPDWPVSAGLEYLKRGDASLVFLSEDPDLLNGQDPKLIATASQAAMEKLRPVMSHIERNSANWLAIGAAVEGWATKVFPHLPPAQRQARLWDAIFQVCRLNNADPVAAWRDHVVTLQARCEYLNRKHYASLKYTAPGTDLIVGLPERHRWMGGRLTSRNGIAFVPNMPTEEVFTLPHKDRAEGVIRASKPLSYRGTMIEDFSFRFFQGRIVEVIASQGKELLQNLTANVEGASRLGELALVPNSSPVSQSGILFYNALIDENAASHIALGNGYRFTLRDGETMSAEEFAAAGGNESAEHLDFMVGSDQMVVDGILPDGKTEPVMHAGEWSFQV